MNLSSVMSGVVRTAAHFRRRGEEISTLALERPKRFPYGAYRFELALPKGTPFIVQASTDLSNWVQIGGDTAGEGTSEYVDSQAFNFNHRFYRVVAGGVLSNVIGYASTTVPPGFSMIASPLAGEANTVDKVLAGWADGAALTRFDPLQFRLRENHLQGGKWTAPHDRFVPGEGALLFNPTSDYKSINFVGEVRPGEQSVPVPSGFSIRSALGPRFGRLIEDLGFPIAEGDMVHVFDRDRQSYVIHAYEGGKWAGESPVIGLCEAFWVGKTSAANWRHTIRIVD
jgi:hypothetical protein